MDGFINDITTMTMGNKYRIERTKSVALLVIHTLFWPLQASKPPECNNSLSLRKISGEGKLAKQKTCLGWYINTHFLRVFMPKEERTSCINNIKDAFSSTKIYIDILESLTGNPNHAEHVITPAQYFLNALHHILKQGKMLGSQHLQPWHIQDLQLWIKLFQRVTTETVPINYIVFVIPTVTLCSDACEYIIRGCINNGLS